MGGGRGSWPSRRGLAEVGFVVEHVLAVAEEAFDEKFAWYEPKQREILWWESHRQAKGLLDVLDERNGTSEPCVEIPDLPSYLCDRTCCCKVDHVIVPDDGLIQRFTCALVPQGARLVRVGDKHGIAFYCREARFLREFPDIFFAVVGLVMV